MKKRLPTSQRVSLETTVLCKAKIHALLVICLWCLSLTVSLWMSSVRADSQLGFTWLAIQAQSDGSLSGNNDLATATQATAEAIRAYRVWGMSANAVVADAEGYLNDEPFHNTEYLARKIIAAAEIGQATAAWSAELLTHQNALDGGFGHQIGYQSTVLDTVFALEALNLMLCHTSILGLRSRTILGMVFPT